MIKIVTILGTRRPGNYTAKALALVQEELKNMSDIEHQAIDPGNLQLAFPGEESKSADAEFLRETVSSASGIILATPEYEKLFEHNTRYYGQSGGAGPPLKAKPTR